MIFLISVCFKGQIVLFVDRYVYGIPYKVVYIHRGLIFVSLAKVDNLVFCVIDRFVFIEKINMVPYGNK